MKINGNKLREAIRDQQLVRDSINSKFNATLFKFDDEVKASPESIASELALVESRIAGLQTLQKQFNVTAQVTVDGVQVPLERAIKAIGGLERIEALWKNAMPYVQRDERRRIVKRDVPQATTVVMSSSHDYEDAKPTVTADQVLSFTQAAVKRVNAYKSAIANGNAVSVDMDVSESLSPFLAE